MEKDLCKDAKDKYPDMEDKHKKLFCDLYHYKKCDFCSDIQEETDNMKEVTDNIQETTDKETFEGFTLMNDERSMNSILVFGLFIILFLFVYIYGFHGILKFEKNLNYLIAILFSAGGIILSIMLIIGSFRYISDTTMTEEEKNSSRNALLIIVVLIVFFSMMAIIRYNYGKLFNALNKTLPANKPTVSKRGRGKRRK